MNKRRAKRRVLGTAFGDVEVVSSAKAETADLYVCPREGMPTPYADNLTGTCNDCGHPIFFRPYGPKTVTRVCIQCALIRVESPKQ
jgi:hypothetical protein